MYENLSISYVRKLIAKFDSSKAEIAPKLSMKRTRSESRCF